jgi:hypothetical protein
MVGSLTSRPADPARPTDVPGTLAVERNSAVVLYGDSCGHCEDGVRPLVALRRVSLEVGNRGFGRSFGLLTPNERGLLRIDVPI